MQGTRLAAFALVALTVAGCMTPHSPASGPTSSQPASANERSNKIAWANCAGFYSENSYLEGMPQVHQDPEWQAPDGWPFYSITITAMDCKQMAWGPFERSVRLILETHDDENVPDSCLPGHPGSLKTLATIISLWVNDTQVADWIRATYDGLTVRSGPIDFTMGAEPHAQAWSWGEAGEPRSTLTLVDEQGDSPSLTTDSFLARYYWFNATRVGYFDVDLKHHDHLLLADHGVYGALAPPMLGASIANGAYVSYGFQLADFSGTGAIQEFKDHLCKEPA